MSTKSTHAAQQKGTYNKDKFADTFMRLKSPYVMTGGELARGLLLSFVIGLGIATLCFLAFH